MTEDLSGPAEMRTQMAALGAQLRWGADLRPPPAGQNEGEVLVCGMGGSGVTGDFLAAVAATEGRRTSVHKDYGLPGWAAREKPSVLVVSYSGNTAEALSSWKMARDLGLSVTVVTSGGELREKAVKAGHRVVIVPGGVPTAVGPGIRALGGAESCRRGGRHLRSPPFPGRGGLDRRRPVRDGGRGDDARRGSGCCGGRKDGGDLWLVSPHQCRSSPMEDPGQRECQAHPLSGQRCPSPPTTRSRDGTSPPGWPAVGVGLLALRDAEEHPGVSSRFGHLESLTSDRVSWVGEVWTQGSSPLARLISLVAVGDLFSLELARLAGADPVRVELIDRLKMRMTPPPDARADSPRDL